MKLTLQRIILLSLVIVLTTAHNYSFAQNDSIISINPHWEKGFTKKYYVEQTISYTDSNKLLYTAYRSYNVTFSVLDKTDSTYTIKWEREKEVELPKEKITDNEFQTNIDEIREEKIIYITSETGKFKKIKNWEEIRDRIGKYCDDYLASLPHSNFNLNNRFPILIKEEYKTIRNIDSACSKTIRRFHYLMGYNYNIYDTARILKRTDLANFEKIDLLLNEMIFFTKISRARKSCSIDVIYGYESDYFKEKYKGTLFALIEKKSNLNLKLQAKEKNRIADIISKIENSYNKTTHYNLNYESCTISSIDFTETQIEKDPNNDNRYFYSQKIEEIK